MLDLDLDGISLAKAAREVVINIPQALRHCQLLTTTVIIIAIIHLQHGCLVLFLFFRLTCRMHDETLQCIYVFMFPNHLSFSPHHSLHSAQWSIIIINNNNSFSTSTFTRAVVPRSLRLYNRVGTTQSFIVAASCVIHYNSSQVTPTLAESRNLRFRHRLWHSLFPLSNPRSVLRSSPRQH